MTYNKAFIITKKDTGCPHSWTITECYNEIIVPYENKEYQYLIKTKSKIEEQIIVNHILQKLYISYIQNCIIQIIDISLSTQMLLTLELLSKSNMIDIRM